MSRDKFEEWAYEIENLRMDRLLDQLGTDGAMYAAWLAGRESMRDEVLQQLEKTEQDGLSYLCVKQIEP